MIKVKSFLLLIIIVIFLVGIGFLLFAKYSQVKDPNQSTPPPTTQQVIEKYEWKIQEIARNLDVPWDLAINSTGEIFITEREGRVKLLQTNGQVRVITSLPQVVSTNESGLTGIVLHPNFLTNGYLYLYYTYSLEGALRNRISRFTFKNNRLNEETIILDNLPGGNIHNGGRLRFGPDHKLWILTGDGGEASSAQSMRSLGGKVLRVNDDGSIPEDNPIKGSPIYSFGHRNPQGLDWHPLTRELFITEHGSNAFDEINLIKAKGNYGWPEVQKCFSDDLRFINPLLCSGTDTWAPSGAAFLQTSTANLQNSLFFAGLRGQSLERVEIVNAAVGDRERIIEGTYGRLRAVISDDKGNLYVTTSNRDGRGTPKSDDDKILKITPQKI